MQFVIARDLAEVAAALEAGAVPVAGGTVASPQIAVDHRSTLRFVDLSRVLALGSRLDAGDAVTIGATTTLDVIHTDLGLGQRFAALVQAAGCVGNPQVRRAATLGGSVALGVPVREGEQVFARPPDFVADVVTALLVLDADVILLGPSGETRRPLTELLDGGRDARQLITGVRLARVEARRSAFEKFAWRQASGKPIVNVAVSLELGAGVASPLRIAVGGQVRNTAAYTSRLPSAEAVAVGRPWNAATVQDVLAAADAGVAFHGVTAPGEAYRRTLVRVGLQALLRNVTP